MTHEGNTTADGAQDLRPGRTRLRWHSLTASWFEGVGRWTLVLALILFPARLHAQLSSISLSFRSVPGSVPLSGAGTNTASLDFGTVSAFEPVPAGVSRTVAASSYTLSTSFGVRTTKNLLSLSPSYTLKARLQSARPLTWRVNGTTMSTTDATIGTSQPYGTAVSHTLALVVPFSQAAGIVDAVLEITAIAN